MNNCLCNTTLTKFVDKFMKFIKFSSCHHPFVMLRLECSLVVQPRHEWRRIQRSLFLVGPGHYLLFECSSSLVTVLYRLSVLSSTSMANNAQFLERLQTHYESLLWMADTFLESSSLTFSVAMFKHLPSFRRSSRQIKSPVWSTREYKGCVLPREYKHHTLQNGSFTVFPSRYRGGTLAFWSYLLDSTHVYG